MAEAANAYEKGDYETALKLFTEASEMKEGQLLRVYAGLYLVNEKLGRKDKADEAFAKLVAISVEVERALTVKFLFGVNSTNFINNRSIRKRYEDWLRHIGEYFQRAPLCLDIVVIAAKRERKDITKNYRWRGRQPSGIS